MHCPLHYCPCTSHTDIYYDKVEVDSMVEKTTDLYLNVTAIDKNKQTYVTFCVQKYFNGYKVDNLKFVSSIY